MVFGWVLVNACKNKRREMEILMLDEEGVNPFGSMNLFDAITLLEQCLQNYNLGCLAQSRPGMLARPSS